MDDEESVLAATRELLANLGMTALTARSTAEALQTVNTARVDVALLDWRLQGHEDGMALGRALWRDCRIPFVVFSGHLNTRAASNAHKLGAADVIEKPLRSDSLRLALQTALHSRPQSVKMPLEVRDVPRGSEPSPQVWSRVVLNACKLARDPRKEEDLAAASNMSLSVLREVCRACNVGGKETTDFARFLRAESLSKEDGSMLRDHLAIRDWRTCLRLFEQAGLATDSHFVPLRVFLLNQKFIPTTKACLRELAHLAANDPLFFVDFER